MPRRISLFFPVVFLLAALFVGVARVVLERQPVSWQLGLLAIAGVLVIYAVPAFRACHRIEVDERSVRFILQFSQVAAPAGSVVEVAPSIWTPSTLWIRTRDGSVVMPSAFDGFSKVIAAIREQNPSAKIRGC